MAELNFGLLTPPGSESIGNAFVRGQDQALASQQMQRQGQLADLQLKKAQNDANILEKIRSASVANGGPPDLTLIANEMIRSGNPEYITQGQGILVKLRQQTEATDYRKRALEGDTPAQGAMPVAAPPANGMLKAAAPQGDFLAAGNQLMPGTGAVNNMPGAAAAPAVNNIPGVTPAAAPAPQAALQARYNKLVRDYHFIGNNPELQSEKALLLEQIKDVQRQARDANTPSPEIKLMAALGFTPDAKGYAEFNAAKANPSEFDRLLAQSNLTLEEQRVARGDKIATESAPKDEVARLLLQLRNPNLSPYEKTTIQTRIAHINSFAPPSNTTIKLPAQENEFAKGLGAGQAKAVMESQTGARDAASIIDTIMTGRELMKSPMITGAGANFFVGLNQALKSAGYDAGLADAAANSQAFAANMASNVGKVIKQFGAGTGLSNADRDYAEKMVGGLITLDANAINRIFDINERAARNIITAHNKKVKGIATNIPLEVEMPSTKTAGPEIFVRGPDGKLVRQ